MSPKKLQAHPAQVKARARPDCESAIVELFATLGAKLAEALAERNERAKLERWPGTTRALRRTQARLRERGIEMAAFELERGVWYLRAEDLEALPRLLGDTGRDVAPVRPANDARERCDVDAEAEDLNAEILGAAGAALNRPQPRRRRAGAL